MQTLGASLSYLYFQDSVQMRKQKLSVRRYIENKAISSGLIHLLFSDQIGYLGTFSSRPEDELEFLTLDQGSQTLVQRG